MGGWRVVLWMMSEGETFLSGSGTRLKESGKLHKGIQVALERRAHGHWKLRLSRKADLGCVDSYPLCGHGEDSLFLSHGTEGDRTDPTSSRHVADSKSSTTHTSYPQGQHLEAQFTSTPAKKAFDWFFRINITIHISSRSR